jgi:hypothetical protein
MAMNTHWVSSTPLTPAIYIPHSPFHLQRLTRAELTESRAMPAAERRLQLPQFVETFRWETIRPLLPLHLANRLHGLDVGVVHTISGWNQMIFFLPKSCVWMSLT